MAGRKGSSILECCKKQHAGCTSVISTVLAVLGALAATAVALRSLSSFHTGDNPAHVQGSERAHTSHPLRHGAGEGHVGASNGLD